MDDTLTLRLLASSSSGNAVFLRVGQTRLLFDVGISMRRITRALADIDESIEALDALVLTHEHSDHVKHLPRLRKLRPDLAVFATRGTIAEGGKYVADVGEYRPIRAGASFRIGQAELTPFRLNHDAAEPCGYRIDADGGYAVGLATDLGFWTDDVADVLAGCQTVVLEANYDPELLENGPYPAFLKRRISSSKGHLSNDQTAWLVDRIAGDHLEHVVLAHRSEKNNDESLARDTVARRLDGWATVVHAGQTKTPTDPLELVTTTPAARTAPQQGVLL